MRNALVGSGLAHVAILVALFLVRFSAPLMIKGENVVQVALTDPGSIPTVAPAAPEQETPSRRPPEIRPEEEEGIQIEKKKPEPRRPQEKEPSRPEPARPSGGTPMRYVSAGPPGLSTGIAGDAQGLDLGFYLEQVRNRVLRNWSPPGGSVGGQTVRTVVYFRIDRSGRVHGVRLESASGIEFFDRAAVRAAMLSDPMPPLPAFFPGSDLGVYYGFNYAQP